MNKWQDPSLTLGERCIAFSENEMRNSVKEDKPNSYTSPRLREYFKICTRLVNGKEVPIGLTLDHLDWCSAGASFALHESLLSGDIPPHGYRLGVVEVVADLQKHGLYRSVAQVRSGNYSINVGDPVIFDRSKPNDPSTSWFRHIARIYSIDSSDSFTCISGNNGGTWRLSKHRLSQPTLLGFGEYPTAHTVKQVVDPGMPDWSNVNILDLSPPQDSGNDPEAIQVYDIIDSILK